MTGRRILVTGASGFIGGRVVARAVEAGARVTGLVRRPLEAPRPRHVPNVPRVAADICHADEVDRAFEVAAPELVIHAAGLPDARPNPVAAASTITTNVLGVVHLLEAARKRAVERVVLLGSAGEYGDVPVPFDEDSLHRPLGVYSVSKLAATRLALTYHHFFGVSCTVVRPFVVYGPGESPDRLFVPVFTAARAGGGPVEFTAGEQRRDFVYIDDVAEGILRAAARPGAAGEVLNLGTGVATSVREAVSLAVEISGGLVTPEFGALPSRVELSTLIANTVKTQRILGWVPSTSLAQGLHRFWEEFQRSSAK